VKKRRVKESLRSGLLLGNLDSGVFFGHVGKNWKIQDSKNENWIEGVSRLVGKRCVCVWVGVRTWASQLNLCIFWRSRNSERDLLAANRFMSIFGVVHFGERE
jgi:hypothetical protein